MNDNAKPSEPMFQSPFPEYKMSWLKRRILRWLAWRILP